MGSAKHRAGKERILKKEKHIAQLFRTYDSEVHPVEEKLPDQVRVYRVRVLSIFLKAGVPISKISLFRDLLKENSDRLAKRKGLSDLIPFVLRSDIQR